jgi:hypothetical protein
MDKKSSVSIQTIAKTASSLSNAAASLGKCINNLAFDGSLVERIKPDLGYLQSIASFVEGRAEGIHDNICGRNALNQVDEDQFSEYISYEAYSKRHSDIEHIRKMKAAVDKAKADGEDMTEWMLKNTNIEDVLTGKVKKPWKPEPVGIGKILREWRGDRFSLYAIAKECGCRAEGLQRIEEGKDVTTTNLMHYLHFVKTHDPQSDVIAAIWAVL